MRELIAGQSKLMEGLSRKVATNDKILENINNRMDSVGTKFRPVPRAHEQAKRVDLAHSSRDVLVNLTLQFTRRES